MIMHRSSAGERNKSAVVEDDESRVCSRRVWCSIRSRTVQLLLFTMHATSDCDYGFYRYYRVFFDVFPLALPLSLTRRNIRRSCVRDGRPRGRKSRKRYARGVGSTTGIRSQFFPRSYTLGTLYFSFLRFRDLARAFFCRLLSQKRKRSLRTS